MLAAVAAFATGRVVPLAGSRQRELLALLLLDAGRVVSTDGLMDQLWGDSQPAARATALRVRVSQLRKAR
jgi:DNA-binding SARP family transcriptional activator